MDADAAVAHKKTSYFVFSSYLTRVTCITTVNFLFTVKIAEEISLQWG